MPHHSVNEVARLKGVSPRTVYRAVTEGRLTADRVGRAVLIEATIAEAWTPMVTKARPQVRADDQLIKTLQSITGYAGLPGSRHFALATPTLDCYRAYLKRMMIEAAAQRASLTVAVHAISTDEARSIADEAVGAQDAARIQVLDSVSTTPSPDQFDPGRQVRIIREALEAGFTDGARQSWYCIDPPVDASGHLEGENLRMWVRFEEGLTRIMRHMPAIVSCVLVGEQGVQRLAAFASAHPVCIVDSGPGFVVESNELQRA